jgi:hypothetical protein
MVRATTSPALRLGGECICNASRIVTYAIENGIDRDKDEGDRARPVRPR